MPYKDPAVARQKERERYARKRDAVLAAAKERYHSAEGVAYRERTAEVRSERHREYYARNKTRIDSRVSDWKRRNRQKVCGYQRATYARQQESVRGLLRNRVKVAVWRAMRGAKLGRSTELLVGWTYEQLRAHIQARFLPGMGWHNAGDWHIDHIVPLAAFSFSSASDPQFKAAWSLSNLQPLWAVDNLRKSDSGRRRRRV